MHPDPRAQRLEVEKHGDRIERELLGAVTPTEAIAALHG